ncbi:GGDEF domain-containing protein [Brevundimonas sp. AJA228-03]|uniref:GGDEF domain-containing protein n=1 Tax=Brevundimonas sp. AJA228-03 TaxID=2752515 RepID=UPI001ADF4C7B|nr:GGDEF domain-containing protein [Brevundimonas sp. AJA228-03]QTN18649.1 GGDEF domain-containing protein [Brevundimonas sp. AJA228-03]
MSTQVQTTLHGPEAFTLARRALGEMESVGVWPTPLNFELWLHWLGEPEGALSLEMSRVLGNGTVFTEAIAEKIAAEYLPRGRLSEEIRDAGAVLNRELSTVSEAIAQAQKSQAAYGETLAGASVHLEGAAEPTALLDVVSNLTRATTEVQFENATLERRLETSTQEIARLRDHLEQVRRDAMTDALTNLANRKAFDEGLLKACDEAEKNRQPMTLAVLDIDHFKRFNDTWGHQTGDQVLRYVASVIGSISKAPRTAARYGGEEFAIIFPSENASAVEKVLNEIREEIGTRALRRRSTNDELGAVTISAGLAQRRPGETGSSLLDRADQALYASKRTGRNKVTNGERLNEAA